ncbi:uncharacterized protein LOC132270311 [Cornus florida]|uniref:uncharacterized protein LOC132270311 n=1 Tax=Cornus florida TaxID=4283 RepID=UPI002899F09B|nr:uncharacterized protein LOC132270311 [Cornus florida]
MLIDPGSSVNVIPKVTFDRLEIKPEALQCTGNSLLGFDGKRVKPIGTVELFVRVSERELVESFVVVKIHPSYNLLMGRGCIHRVQGVTSTLHQVMQCLNPDESKVIDIHEDQVTAKECYLVTLKAAGKGKALIRSIDHLRPDQTTKVGSGLAEEEKCQLVDILSRNANKQRRFAPKRNQIIADEVDRLLEAGFIIEVQYPSWLSNVVVMQKKNRKWKICIDFTNLNKACPNDSFPFSKINQMVDAMTGYERLTFMDAYSGYNQIAMDPNDEEKTSFVIERGIYCYKVMPFGLKNARATY